MTVATLAFDRSLRRKDEDGRLHIEWTNISKATVNPYYGREIPRAAELGLDPDKTYQLFRDPDELAKGAATFNNIQLMSVHRAVNAADPAERLVAGSTGTDAEFRDPYLGNSLVIWRQEDIDDIESREKCELSCAYYYDADMTPGTYKGLRYDGVMRNIRGNHVALVPAGRAGPDVMVHDGERHMAEPLTSRKALLVRGALTAYLRPKLTAGPMLAMDGILGSVTAKNWRDQKAKVETAILQAAKPRLAQDAKLDDLKFALDSMDDEEDGKAEDDDLEAMDADLTAEEREEEREAREKERKDGMAAGDRKKARDARKGARDAKRAKDKAAKDAVDPDKKDDKDADKGMDKAAMDAAIGVAVAKASSETEARVVARMNAVAKAREDVRPIIGQVSLALDSAPAIYRLALDHLKIDLTDVPEAAYGALVKAAPKLPANKPVQAFDHALAGAIDVKFPSLARIGIA